MDIQELLEIANRNNELALAQARRISAANESRVAIEVARTQVIMAIALELGRIADHLKDKNE